MGIRETLRHPVVAWRAASPDDPLDETAWQWASSVERSGRGNAGHALALASGGMAAIVTPTDWPARVGMFVAMYLLALWVVVPVATRVWFFLYAPAHHRDRARATAKEAQADLEAACAAIERGREELNEIQLKSRLQEIARRAYYDASFLDEFYKHTPDKQLERGDTGWRTQELSMHLLHAEKALNEHGRIDLRPLLPSGDAVTGMQTPREHVEANQAFARQVQDWVLNGIPTKANV